MFFLAVCVKFHLPCSQSVAHEMPLKVTVSCLSPWIVHQHQQTLSFHFSSLFPRSFIWHVSVLTGVELSPDACGNQLMTWILKTNNAVFLAPIYCFLTNIFFHLKALLLILLKSCFFKRLLPKALWKLMYINNSNCLVALLGDSSRNLTRFEKHDFLIKACWCFPMVSVVQSFWVLWKLLICLVSASHLLFCSFLTLPWNPV